MDSHGTDDHFDGLLSVCCARLAVAWGRLLAAPKAASKTVLKQAKDAEAAVTRVASVIKDAQDSTGINGCVPVSPHVKFVIFHHLFFRTALDCKRWLADKAKEHGVVSTGSGLMFAHPSLNSSSPN
jgi:hypothetical protein